VPADFVFIAVTWGCLLGFGWQRKINIIIGSMYMFNVTSVFVAFILAFLSFPALSTAYNVDPAASVVHLRSACVEGTAPQVTVDNCFDLTADLSAWITNTRQPTAADPLVVEVGPGSFGDLSLTCSNWGHITFNGSGRSTTNFIHGGFNSCTGMVFQHLSFGPGGGFAAVNWYTSEEGTSSRWVDVELTGSGYGWYESKVGDVCTNNVKGDAGTHYWFSSKIAATGGLFSVFKLAYRDGCGSENWFFGSELLAEAKSGSTYELSALSQDSMGDTHFYGSVIRAITDIDIAPGGGVFCEISNPRPLVSAICAGGGSVHLHGTGVDVISNPTNGAVNTDIAAIVAGPGSMVHANGSAYNMKIGTSGSLNRIVNNNATVHAPYQWQESTTPPNIISQDGADVAVVTTPAGAPKFIVYSTNCPSKWHDVGANACLP